MGYSSDLTDAEWEIISTVIYSRKGKQGRPPPSDARMLWDGIFYVCKNGCFWRDIPDTFGPWKRVYNYFNRLKHRKVIDKLNEEVHSKVRIKLGKSLSPSMGILDSQSVKTHSFKKCRERL